MELSKVHGQPPWPMDFERVFWVAQRWEHTSNIMQESVVSMSDLQRCCQHPPSPCPTILLTPSCLHFLRARQPSPSWMFKVLDDISGEKTQKSPGACTAPPSFRSIWPCFSRRPEHISFLLIASYSSCPSHCWLAPAKHRPQTAIKSRLLPWFLAVFVSLLPTGWTPHIQRQWRQSVKSIAPSLSRGERPVSCSKTIGCFP